MVRRVTDLHPAPRPARGFGLREFTFSIAEARRALPYVSRLLNDAVHAYQCVQDARHQLLFALGKCEIDELIHQRDYAIDRLNTIIDECNAVGLAHIHIPTGRAAFHTEINSRAATLLWHVGDPLCGAWRDLDGFTLPTSPHATSALNCPSAIERNTPPARTAVHATR